ncbi:MAG: hypothetical protein AAB368_07095, partial [bacterium]
VAADARVVLAWNQSTSFRGNVTTYAVYRNTFAGPVTVLTVTVTGVPPGPFTALGVTNGTPAYYVVRADDWGVVTDSPGAFALPLGTPSTLTASAGNNRVVLRWTVPGGNAGVSAFVVYRMSPTQGWAVTATVFGPAATIFTDTTVANGVLYTYRVRAADRLAEPGVNYSQFSATISMTSAVAPSAPVLQPIIPGNQRLTLAWGGAVAGTNPIGGYSIYRASGPLSFVLLTAVSTTYFDDTTVTNGVSWSYKIATFDNTLPPTEGAQSGVGSAVPFAAPQPPSALTVQKGNGSLTVGWMPPAPTTFAPASYNVYRGLAANGENLVTPVNVSPVTATFFTDTGLVNGTVYFYKVRTLDDQGHASTTRRCPYGKIESSP